MPSMICKTISCLVLCIIQYEFNVWVNTQLVTINTNYTLLAHHLQQLCHQKMV